MKLNSTIYNKLLLQAKEAEEQGLTKLANNILNAIGDSPQKEEEKYSYSELQEDIYNDLWKSAARIMAYYDLNSVQIEKLNETIHICAVNLTNELEITLGVDEIIAGPFEPKTFGENE